MSNKKLIASESTEAPNEKESTKVANEVLSASVTNSLRPIQESKKKLGGYAAFLERKEKEKKEGKSKVEEEKNNDNDNNLNGEDDEDMEIKTIININKYNKYINTGVSTNNTNTTNSGKINDGRNNDVKSNGRNNDVKSNDRNSDDKNNKYNKYININNGLNNNGLNNNGLNNNGLNNNGLNNKVNERDNKINTNNNTSEFGGEDPNTIYCHCNKCTTIAKCMGTVKNPLAKNYGKFRWICGNIDPDPVKKCQFIYFSGDNASKTQIIRCKCTRKTYPHTAFTYVKDGVEYASCRCCRFYMIIRDGILVKP